MKRNRKDEPEPFWPVIGIDYPYPPRVQEALDLVEAETKRRKIKECEHEGRYPTHMYPRGEGLHSRPYHVCACSDCGAERIACIPKDDCDPRYRRRTEIYGVPYERASAALPIMVTTSSSDPVRDVGGVLMVNAEGSFASSLAAEIAEDMEEMDRDMREMRRQMDRDMREMKRDMERMRPRQEGQLRRSISVSSEELDWERVKARNRARQAMRTRLPSVISDPNDMSWIKTTNKR